MIPWILLAVRAALAPNACLPISGERVLARDLARAVPAFAGLAPELVLGYAPGPGARRIFENAELDRLARRYGLAAEPGVAACFVRRLETLTNAGVTEALRAAWPGARIELVDFSRQPIPRGDLRFPVSGLRQDPAGSAPWLWRGAVRAPGQDDFPVWAKVRIEVSGTRVTAAEALTAGHPIARTQLREEPYLGPPGLPGLAQIVGRAPRRQIPAGAAIEAQWLDTPADILRGQRVRLEVRSGRMRLILEGEAQSSGSRGETIGVRNPANGKILRATVAAPGRAVLTADPGESAKPMKKNSIPALLLLAATLVPAWAAAKKKAKPPEISALDRYVAEATAAARANNDASSGSLWFSAALLTNLACDLRASRVNDTVTVLVAENASAVSSGNVQTARTSSAKASITALGGATKATGALANLLGTSGDQELKGSGTIGRQTVISTTLGTRVVHVLPNGYLVVEGVKEIRVSSEQQTITVRGVVRPADLSPNNVVQSDLIAQLEVSVNGKGVVGDAIKRPFILYRLLMGLLPI